MGHELALEGPDQAGRRKVHEETVYGLAGHGCTVRLALRALCILRGVQQRISVMDTRRIFITWRGLSLEVIV